MLPKRHSQMHKISSGLLSKRGKANREPASSNRLSALARRGAEQRHLAGYEVAARQGLRGREEEDWGDLGRWA